MMPSARSRVIAVRTTLKSMTVCGLLLAWLACGSEQSNPTRTLALESEDPRFALVLDSGGSEIGGATGERRLRIEPKDGWHMTPEAPTRLELSSTAGIELLQTRQTIKDAVHGSEERIVFAVRYRSRGDGHFFAGSTHQVTGHLKFGVCRDDNPRCEIVERDLSFAVANSD